MLYNNKHAVGLAGVTHMPDEKGKEVGTESD